MIQYSIIKQDPKIYVAETEFQNDYLGVLVAAALIFVYFRENYKHRS